MPSTTPERAARWPGMDQEAMAYLKAQGYSLTRGWGWLPPSSDHVSTDREIDALRYLIEEWDFGGIVPKRE